MIIETLKAKQYKQKIPPRKKSNIISHLSWVTRRRNSAFGLGYVLKIALETPRLLNSTVLHVRFESWYQAFSAQLGTSLIRLNHVKVGEGNEILLKASYKIPVLWVLILF